jgi:hypothetical protein
MSLLALCADVKPTPCLQILRLALFDWELVGKNFFMGRVMIDVANLRISVWPEQASFSKIAMGPTLCLVLGERFLFKIQSTVLKFADPIFLSIFSLAPTCICAWTS